MHRRRGGKFFSLSRHILVRTNATVTKRAVSAQNLRQYAHSIHALTRCFVQVSAQPGAWGIPDSRPTPPPSPLTTSTPASVGKWAPPISKWAKPESQIPPVKAEGQGKPILRRQNQIPSNQGPRPKPSASFIQPRGAPAPGKWSRPSGFTLSDPPSSTPAKPSVDEPVTGPSRVFKANDRNGWTDLRREQAPKIGESSRSFIQPRGGEYAARQNRRWEGNGKHKARGSLLSGQGQDVIFRQPRVQDVTTTSKPKVRKAKKSLRVNPDINIPSTVSVGNFARLLNVSLGKVFGLSNCRTRW
jgi:hypothetical protein